MTLVVTEVTGLGVVIAADSAVTYTANGIETVRSGVAKVQYSDRANIGFGMWGRACVGTTSMDSWLERFIDEQVSDNDQLENVALRLAQSLTDALKLPEHR